MVDSDRPVEPEPQHYTHRLNHTEDKIAPKNPNIILQFLQKYTIHIVSALKNCHIV